MKRGHFHKCKKCGRRVGISCGCGYPRVNTSTCGECHTAATLAALEARGFDRCDIDEEDGGVHVGCSQCAALAINGVACHETGCPRQTHECAGCDAIIPARQRYCEDCSL